MTSRLVTLAYNQWESVDGYAVGHGVDLMALPLDRFCNFIWWLFTRNGSDTDIAKFKARIWRPPVGQEADERSPWSAENESKAFASLKAQLGK